MTLHKACMTLAALVAVLSLPAQSADAQRQAGVAQLGAAVMPFSLAATTHVFTRTTRGGVQRVVAKDPADAAEVGLVRGHLRALAGRFEQRDFSEPAHIHGQAMPGLATLAKAKPSDLTIDYRDVPAGGKLTFRGGNARIVAALHAWFDAQLSDHGADAMAGHDHAPPAPAAVAR